MLRFRQPKCLIVVAALVLVFAGCKGESPTAPSGTTGTGGGGGTTPATTTSIALSVSNPTPQVDSTSVITATVTQNNAAAPNGTAVEFTTNFGLFEVGNSKVQTTILTTTNGVATITLGSSAAGTATVTATVANVSKSTTVTFQLKPVEPVPPDFTPSITGITPTLGSPAGGTMVTITGKNFQAPVRVLFDLGNGVSKEAFVSSVTPTQIQVVSPGIDLGAGQQANATIVLINNYGTPNETRLTAASTFTYQNTTLTPKITTLSPSSGPIDGGTQVTIFGEGFQAPLQVFFGSAEAQVINVTFSQIKVIAPNASTTTPNGSGTVTGPVDIKVININSATQVSLTAGFRYVAKMVITAISPTQGPVTGGTQVRIDGAGFNDPVTVTIAGFPAQVTKVTGTEVTVVTNAIEACANASGAVVVTNVDNGDNATSAATFTFQAPVPQIISASGGTVGGPMTVTVLNANGIPRITVGTMNLMNITSSTSGNITTFTGTIPLTFPVGTQACSGVSGVSTPIAVQASVGYTGLLASCSITATPFSTTISPQSAAAVTLSPLGLNPFTAKFTPATFGPAVPPATVGPQLTNATVTTPSAPQTILIANSGTAPLTITSVTNSCGTNFSVSGPAAGTTVAPCGSEPIIVGFTPPQPANLAATTYSQSYSCTISLVTSAGTKTISVSGSVQ